MLDIEALKLKLDDIKTNIDAIIQKNYDIIASKNKKQNNS
jgi:hypothetical protein